MVRGMRQALSAERSASGMGSAGNVDSVPGMAQAAAPGTKRQSVRSPDIEETVYGSITNFARTANPSS